MVGYAKGGGSLKTGSEMPSWAVVMLILTVVLTMVNISLAVTSFSKRSEHQKCTCATMLHCLYTGDGQETWIHVFNNTGDVVKSGRLAYINGVIGYTPTIVELRGTRTVGLVTDDIEAGETGLIRIR